MASTQLLLYLVVVASNKPVTCLQLQLLLVPIKSFQVVMQLSARIAVADVQSSAEEVVLQVLHHALD